MTRALTRRGLNPQVLTGRYAYGRRRIDPLAMLMELLSGGASISCPQFLTMAEASQYSGLSVKFLTRLIELRKLPALRDGRTLKVRRSDLDTLPSVAQLAKLMSTRDELRQTLAARRAR